MEQQNTLKQLTSTEFRKSIEQDISQLQNCLNTRQKGQIAENIASKYLINKGLRLIERNYYCRRGELDLVMYDPIKKSYVFVEVKSIQNEKTIAITQTISKTKAYHLKMSAQKWISTKVRKWCDWRIDFIGIVLDNITVVHIPSAIW